MSYGRSVFTGGHPATASNASSAAVATAEADGRAEHTPEFTGTSALALLRLTNDPCFSSKERARESRRDGREYIFINQRATVRSPVNGNAAHAHPPADRRRERVSDEISSWDFTPQSDFENNNICYGGWGSREKWKESGKWDDFKREDDF